jgi:DNA-binding NtrC family response regulator
MTVTAIEAHQSSFGAAEALIVGSSPGIVELRSTIEKVARGNAKVLITGESGVGKDLVGRCLHARSLRAGQPFVPVNCAAFNETLLESELFGHVRGSFTGAYRDKAGKLQLAQRGTVFLDEVGEMSLRMQALLLRFLENGEIQPVGSDAGTRRVDVRVVAATNRDLGDLIATGRFRADLMYRLRVIHIHVPPLRERREDIPALVRQIQDQAGRATTFSDEALAALRSYSWPGNVRELQNVVEQVCWTSSADIVRIDHLPEALRENQPGPVAPSRERRRQIADELHEGLAAGTFGFWDHVRQLLLQRDITRRDLRQLVRRGLAATGGNYRAVLRLFGMPESEYKRFLNFLAAHDCVVDFREFRTGQLAEREEVWNPLAAVDAIGRDEAEAGHQRGA